MASPPGCLPLLLGTVALSSLLIEGVAAQEDGLDLRGMGDKDGYGMAVAILDDLDGDAVPELLVSAFCTDWPGINAGSVKILSGRDGRMIAMLHGEAARDRLGEAACAAGDLDGDGVGDIAAGARQNDRGGADAGAVFLYRGRDLGLMGVLAGTVPGGNFGVAVAAAGDTDGDGFADLLVGADREGGGVARVFSGRTGILLHRVEGAAGDDLGLALAGVGDLDGDGLDDFAVAAPGAGGDRGRVTVHSGRDAALLLRLDGAHPGDRLGSALAATGDVDGDHVPDLAVGVPGADVSVGKDAGSVLLLSGADGRRLLRVQGDAPGDAFGFALAGAGDMDGDGVPDLLVGAPYADADGPGSGLARVHSGRDGSVLWSVAGAGPGDHLGAALAAGAALDGDSRPDLLAGAPNAALGAMRPGAVFLRYAPERSRLRPFGPDLPGRLWLLLEAAEPGSPCLLLATARGFGRLVLPGALPDLDLHPSAQPVAAGTSGGHGSLLFRLQVPGGLAGEQVACQAVAAESGGLRPSNALQASLR